MVGEGGELLVEVVAVGEGEVLAAGEGGDVGGGVGAEGAPSHGDGGSEVKGVEDVLLAGHGVGLVLVAVASELVVDPLALGGEGEAVEGGVGLGEAADDGLGGGVAALVVGLAEEEDDAAGFGGLLCQEVDGARGGVEEGGSVVAGFGMK